ncbi:MAG: beta-lactamase family protein, partial [Alphaproteobacteria bacterium]|nr:beta-lactamase family protein [Alphaproteobacteria bacterium]
MAVKINLQYINNSFGKKLPRRRAANAGRRPQPNLESQINAFFARWDRADQPGGQIAVVRGGRLIHCRGYGAAVVEHGIPHRPKTRYRIASITKHFVSVALLLLQDEGKLTLDDPVRRHLADLPDYGHGVTIRHMLTMTSGIRDLGETLWLSGVMPSTVCDRAYLHDLTCRHGSLNFAPGREISYSNTNYRLVQYIVEKLARQSLAQFLRRRVFKPLGMNATALAEDQTEVFPDLAGGYWFDRDGHLRRGQYGLHYSGSGGLVSTIDDLLRWHQAWRDGGPFRKGLLDQMTEPARLANGLVAEYGLGLALARYRGRPSLRHGGSLPRFRSYFLRFPEDDLGIIVLSNPDEAAAMALARPIADIALGDRLAPTPRLPRD